MRPVVFLNLDGVCHQRQTQYAVLRGYPHVGPAHFGWAASLQAVLERWDASVVLRSSAVSIHGLDGVKSLAPAWLQSRVAGATGDVVRYIALFELRKVNTSFGTIRTYVQQHELEHWVTLSDDDDGWPATPEARKHLVQCDGEVGLSDPMVARRLDLAIAECRP